MFHEDFSPYPGSQETKRQGLFVEAEKAAGHIEAGAKKAGLVHPQRSQWWYRLVKQTWILKMKHIGLIHFPKQTNVDFEKSVFF